MNDMTELRGILFDTLRDLRTNKDADVERARAVRDIAGVLVDTARVETDMIRATGAQCGSGFLSITAPNGQPEKITAPNGSITTTELLGTGVRKITHKAA